MRLRPLLLAGSALTLALLVVAFVPQLLGSEVRRALAGLSGARPVWLWLAAVCFVGSLAGTAAAWRSAIGLVGGRVGWLDAGARYGIGSLVNSFAPARLGDLARLTLFSRVLEGDGRLWQTGGSFGVIGAARALMLAVLIVAGAIAGALPLWPVLVLLVLTGAAGLTAARRRNRTARSRLAHVLDAFGTLGREPRHGLRILGWIALATAARLGAAASIAAALGVGSPLLAALLVVPALDLSGLMPLTPGSVGLTTGAVAMALRAHGVGATTALTTGIAFHGVEAAAGIAFGLASALFLAPFSSDVARRRTVLALGTASCVVLAAAFGATVLADLV
ncbi:MAG TPA: lysylphosphatidylglycerol synthase domain-containing protein [Gaiellaceae bacterium]|nr:lysylphosphatidylglycerol synthase domain-containing protein [Gaiellaceae bacterium]